MIAMKNNHINLLFLLVLLFWSCEQQIPSLEELPSPEAGCISCPEGANSGDASFAKFVTIGNSYVAGFQAGALYDEGQSNSLAKLISQQIACAGGSDVFNQPDINSFNGYNVQLSNPGQGIVLGRLILFDDGTGAAPAPAGAPGIPSPYNTADLPTSFMGDKSALNNFGVPLIYLGQALIPDTGNPQSPYFNPLWARFASQPGVKSIAEDALAAAGSFYLIWLGIDDALLHAATGADGTYPLTSIEDFSLQYNGLISTMLVLNPVFKGVIGNIQSLVTYPYFTTISYNSIPLDAATASALEASLATNYNTFVTAMASIGAITEQERDRRLLSYKEGDNNILVTDEELTDLTELMVNNGAAQLVPFAQARQTTESDLIPLSAGAVLGEPYLSIPTAIQGVSWPLSDNYALTFSEIVQIETNIAGFNAIIESAAAGSNDRLAVADVSTALNELLQSSISSGGLLVNGVALSSSISPPTAAYSEDGLHPNTRGYAFLGNVFIDAINSKFGSSVPQICINEFAGTGLPVSP